MEGDFEILWLISNKAYEQFSGSRVLISCK